MPNMNAGHVCSCLLQTLPNEKRSVFEALDDNSAVCSNQLSCLVENGCKQKSGHFASFSSGFRKILLRSAENDPVEQFRHNM